MGYDCISLLYHNNIVNHKNNQVLSFKSKLVLYWKFSYIFIGFLKVKYEQAKLFSFYLGLNKKYELTS